MRHPLILLLAGVWTATITVGISRSEAAPTSTVPTTGSNVGSTASKVNALPVALEGAADSSSDSKRVLTEPDRIFFRQAAQNGYFDIEASKLAEAQATDPAIKAFASKMIAEHTAADADLKRLAALKKVKLPENNAGSNKGALQRLQKLKGQEFDRTYVQQAGVVAHTEAISLFQTTSISAFDQDVQDFATKMLPTLRAHLEMAKVLPGAGAAGAPNPATNSSSDSKRVLTEPDRIFFRQAAQNGYFEIEASKLAEAQATDPAIKAFASKMIAEHTAADADLKRLATLKKVKLPENNAGSNKGILQRLQKLKGQEFDRSYVQQAGVVAHTEAISLFGTTSVSAFDQDVKDFATKMLPTLRAHLEMAKALPGAGVAGTKR